MLKESIKQLTGLKIFNLLKKIIRTSNTMKIEIIEKRKKWKQEAWKEDKKQMVKTIDQEDHWFL